MERVLYFSGYRLSAFHWQGKKLVGQFSFDPGDSGFEKFDEYLEKTHDVPSRFLVDIIEEDFKQDVIPHIRGKDRADLIKRTEARLFRGEEYAAMASQGKDPANKHKELVLFSALTNAELIKPWIEKLDQWEVPLSGIWSVPMMSNSLLPKLGVSTKYVLLISQQVPSSLRQSFFEDGKLIFSRQSKIKYDLREVGDAMSYSVLLANEIEHTERYLTNHRLVGFNDKVSVCCLVRDEFKKDISSYLEPTDILDYRIYSIQKLEKKLGFSDGQSNFGDVLFARLCVLGNPQKEHYIKPKERRFYDEFRMKKLLYNSSVACVFLALIATMGLIFEAITLGHEANEINGIVGRVEATYQEKYASLEPELERAIAMKSAVDLADTIKIDGKIAPRKFYLELSKIVSKPMFSGLFVEKIQWKKELASEAKVFTQRIYADDYDPYLNQEEEIQDDSGVDHKVHLVMLKGRVPIGERPYRITIAVINAFIGELEQHPEVSSVDVVDLPIDLRPSSSFSDQSGVSHLLEKKDASNEGYFTIRIVMKGHSNV